MNIVVDGIERRKILLLTVCFFLVMGGYTIVRELKDLVFVNIVGLEAIPTAKLWCILVLVPLVFFYSYLVDALKRNQLLCVCALVYAVIGMVCAYFLGHPTIGLPNTDASSGRIFGWFFYFFMESFQPFLISVLWSFVNSITKPEDAKAGYSFMVAGGILVEHLWQRSPGSFSAYRRAVMPLFRAPPVIRRLCFLPHAYSY